MQWVAGVRETVERVGRPGAADQGTVREALEERDVPGAAPDDEVEVAVAYSHNAFQFKRKQHVLQCCTQPCYA